MSNETDYESVRRLLGPLDTEPASPSIVDMRRAMADGRRRVRMRRMTGAAAAAVVTVLAVAGAPLAWQGIAGPVSPPPLAAPVTVTPGGPTTEAVESPGTVVVTSYRAGAHDYVLNPATGEYQRWDEPQPFPVQRGNLSPDLRWHASLSSAPDRDGRAVTIRSTVDLDDVRTVPIPVRTASMPVSMSWSADSRRIAVVSEGDPGLTSIDVVDVEDAAATEIELQFRDGQRGWDGYFPGDPHLHPTAAVQWLDDDRLLVPTITAASAVTGERGGRLPHRAATEASTDPNVTVDGFVIHAMAVFDLSGTLVAELPVSTHAIEDSPDPHAELIWTPTGLARGGDQLLLQEGGPGSVTLAVVDPWSDHGPYRSVTVTLPAPPGAEPMSPGGFHAWLPDGRVLIRSPLVLGEDGPWRPDPVVVDLDSGEARVVNLADVVTGDIVPAGATDITLADASPLPAASAHLAFDLPS
jgi:hypothetical protein